MNREGSIAKKAEPPSDGALSGSVAQRAGLAQQASALGC
jgi:hypothetical protein